MPQLVNAGMENGARYLMGQCQISGAWSSCACNSPYHMGYHCEETAMVGYGIMPHSQLVRPMLRLEREKGWRH